MTEIIIFVIVMALFWYVLLNHTEIGKYYRDTCLRKKEGDEDDKY